MHFINQIRSAARKRAQYNRTRREIRSMPLDVALALGIFRADAHLIANHAVYGR